jgi:hypothetical protein
MVVRGMLILRKALGVPFKDAFQNPAVTFRLHSEVPKIRHEMI